jgi:uncharacterized delta-60 repeat protein
MPSLLHQQNIHRRTRHLPFTAALALFVSLFCAVTAGAAGGDLDTTFSSPINPTNIVYAIALQADGKIIVGGRFTAYNGAPRNRVARLNSDGSLDTTFDPGAGAGFDVNAIALQADGKVIIGGQFTTYNGTTRNRIARLNSNGSLDTSFDPGTGANEFVQTIVVQPDGKILIGGFFTEYNGTPRNRIARLNSDGTLDMTFNPGMGADGVIFKIILQPDGKVLVIGHLGRFNGVQGNLARLNSDGSLDNTFTPGTGANGTIFALALQADGKLIIGGQFTSFNGTSRKYIARLNSNGTLDTTFDPGTRTATPVEEIVVQSDGKMVVVNAPFHDFVTSNSLTRFNSDGTLDTAFNRSTIGDHHVETIALQPDDKLLVSSFFFVNGDIPHDGLVRLNGNGSLDTSFELNTGATDYVTTVAEELSKQILVAGTFVHIRFGPESIRIARLNRDNGAYDFSWDTLAGPNDMVNAAVPMPDSKVIIGGQFTTYNGTSRNRIARLNNNGSLDTSFDPGTGANDYVAALALQADGKLIIGGQFTMYNGTPRNRIARLNSNGSLVTSFDTGTGANGAVNALALQADGKILIAGDFTTYNGTSRNRVARLNSNGSLDTTFDPGSGAGGVVNAVALQSDGKLLIVGDFTVFNGTSRGRIARLNSNGSLDITFDPGSGANAVINAVAIQRDGKILIGGAFTSYNFSARTRIAQLHSNAIVDLSFDPGTGPNAPVRSIALQSDGRIIIGGLFTSYNGTAAQYVARLFPALNALAFSILNYRYHEGTERATITINRYGDTTQAASVQYSTSDLAGLDTCDVVSGHASARCDYTAVGGTLTFAPGQSSQTFTIPLIMDAYMENAETLTVTLSNALGDLVVTQSSATVTIVGDAPIGPNPLGRRDFFVRQHYLDFLNREPEPSGLNAWLAILNNCPQGDTRCDEIEVSSAFFRSPEFFDRSYFLYRFYEAALGRQPQFDEYQNDLRRLTGFLSAEELEQRKRQFVEEFMARPEFRALYDSQVSAQQFVDAVLAKAGAARPGVGAATVVTANRQDVINRLQANQITRAQALRELMESPEVSQRFFNKAFVVVEYFAYLRRNPDAAYLHWINVLNTTGDYREMIRGFLQSPEYRSRFGPM